MNFFEKTVLFLHQRSQFLEVIWLLRIGLLGIGLLEINWRKFKVIWTREVALYQSLSIAERSVWIAHHKLILTYKQKFVKNVSKINNMTKSLIDVWNCKLKKRSSWESMKNKQQRKLTRFHSQGLLMVSQKKINQILHVP